MKLLQYTGCETQNKMQNTTKYSTCDTILHFHTVDSWKVITLGASKAVRKVIVLVASMCVSRISSVSRLRVSKTEHGPKKCRHTHV